MLSNDLIPHLFNEVIPHLFVTHIKLCFRFKTYYNQTMPIIEHYKKGGLVHKINAIPQPDEVIILLLFEEDQAHTFCL